MKVVDFGIAKAIERSMVSRSGSLKGKVSYMSPEQVHGHGLDGRSDLFAIGIVLHEILSGERLFVAKTEAATLSRLLTQPIPCPSALNDQVPADLDNIVMRLLERDREHRYTRAKDAMDALIGCSVAAKGRTQLETVLTERFSDRVPQRVSRLNSSSSSNGFSASYETSDAHSNVVPDTASDLMASAETVAATPSSKSTPSGTEVGETSAERTPPPPQDEGKRTVTAGPVAQAPESSATLAATKPDVVVREESRRGKWVIFAGIALLLCGSLSLYLLSKGSEQSEQTQPVFVGVDPPDASLPLDAHPIDATVREKIVDAGAENQANSDASTQVPPQTPVSPDAGSLPPQNQSLDSDDKKGKLATLTIEVQPWAAIEIDGKQYGQTPQTIELRPGKHKIILTNPGLRKKESFSLSLKSGRRKLVTKNWL